MALNDIKVPRENASGTFDEITLPDATTSARGLLTSADKTKLDGLGTSSTKDAPATGNASSSQVVLGNDARLSDSRTPTAHAASHAAGVKASYDDQAAGMSENVFIRANNVGTAGNSITLTFDGVDDIDTVLEAWNAANTSNTAELVSGDGSQVPDDLEEITLSGGVAAGSDAIIDARFDSLKINGGEVEFGSPINPDFLPFKVESQDATNVQIAQVLGFNKKGAAFYGTGALGTDGPVVQATHYQVTNSVNFYVNPYGGGVSVGKTTNGAKLDVGGKIRLSDTSDGTKQVELSAASVGTGQVRVVTFPNKNITLDDAGDARTPTSHAHGNITNDGKVGSDSGRVLVTTTAGAVTTLALGSANQVLKVNSGGTAVEFGAAGGVTSGSVDNAVLRADGTGGSTSQSSDLVIDDATTSTQANVALRNNHSETNSALVLTPKGTGAFIVGAKPDGSSGGIARGIYAIDINMERSNSSRVAAGARSICIGAGTLATQAAAIAIGNGAWGDGSASIGIGQNALGGYGGATNNICIGTSTECRANNSICIGNGASITSGSSTSAVNILGGAISAAVANSFSLGGAASLRAQVATLPFSAVYWGGQTTTNAATILNLDAAATNRFTIAASTALAVDILLVARRATTQDKWLVARRFLGIRRDATNPAALIGDVQTLGIDQKTGSPTWSFTLTADTGNNALQLQVTGETGETVEWRATAIYRVA